MSQDRFQDEKYVSWLKLKLSLQYAKEGLESITDNKVNTFHGSIKSSLLALSSSSTTPTPTCNICVKTGLQKQWDNRSFSCLVGICDGWLRLLQSHHVSPSERVEWGNVNLSKLPVNPWECAKIYLPYGSDKVQCAGDADLAAILTLHMKCDYFYTRMGDASLCEKVKDVRNDLLHSGSMKIDATRMQADVGLIKTLLMDPAFATDNKCQDAVNNIDQLLGGKLELSLNRELELRVLNDDIKVVRATTYQLQTSHDMLTKDVLGLTDRVDQCEQLRTEVSDMSQLRNDHQTLFAKLVEAQDQIAQLQKLADLLSNFIKASKIHKLDLQHLADSIGHISTLNDKMVRLCQVLEKQQQIVCRHELILSRHGLELDQQRHELAEHTRVLTEHKQELDQLNQREARRSCSNQHHTDALNVASLQEHLIDTYKDDCVWKNPVTGDEHVNISQMYARPAINLLRQKDTTGRLVEVQRNSQYKPMLPSYRQVFYTNNNQCQNIYITGDAGMGKTTFCRQLVYTWCKAAQNSAEEEDSEDDLSVLREFTFLFYLKLRDVESDYHIEDMIKQYVVHNAPSGIDVSAILKSEKCLVVLDGLDEWSCPKGIRKCRNVNSELPGRNTSIKNCVFVTTTRNWKFDVIDLTTNDVDKHVEFCGLCETSSHELAGKTLELLNSKSQSKATVVDFFKEVHVKKLASLTNVPILLVQLLSLWFFCTDLGNSQVQLFSKMLDLLFEQARKHLPKKSTVAKPVHITTELPECFTGEESCRNHTQLILCLSKVAFESLLNKKKELSLVFKSSKLEICGIDESDIALCLKSGILTQSKVFDIETGRLKKYSFLHKKLQEFLAAVHLVTSDDIEGNMRQLKEYCDKLDTTLEMGQVFLFVCGMRADIGKQVLQHLTTVVLDDRRVHKSRQSILPEQLIRSIQTCVTDCVAEGSSNEFTYDVHLQDYWVDVITISHYNECVVRKKAHTIKSVYIDTAH